MYARPDHSVFFLLTSTGTLLIFLILDEAVSECGRTGEAFLHEVRSVLLQDHVSQVSAPFLYTFLYGTYVGK